MIVTSTNSVWQILSLKYDQKHHYTWPATLQSDDGECLRLSTLMGGLLVHYTRGFQEIQTLRSDLTFWRERWYNVFTNYDADGKLRNFYCNVAMPPLISNNTLQYVDLDLDVRFNPDGSHEILDEDEFELHAVEFGYSSQIREQAMQALDDLFTLAKSRIEPFNLLNT